MNITEEPQIDWQRIETKWQEKWEKDKIFESNPGSGPKFFLTFPYPYMNAYPHIGHFYTLARVDLFARYKRMKGFNVLFPQGWHCTGSPIISAAKRIAEKEEKQWKMMREMGFKDEEISEFSRPEKWAEYFPKEWKKAFQSLGISIDWRREFITTSLNPHYDKFIDWQFRKLKELNYVVKGKHPVVWCPKDNTPVGDHDRVEGEGEGPEEFVLLKFKLNDPKIGNVYLIAATLRPETIYGQTNLWVDPELEYVIANVDGEIWIISKECSKKLKEQDKKVEIIGKVKGKELLGKYCRAPGIDREIIILPSGFCDPTKGTGIVTSVPSDAPDDWMGLYDLQNNAEECKKYGLDFEKIKAIKPIAIIDSKGLGDMAAVKVCADMQIKNQYDREKLDEAKHLVYKKGYYEGKMNKNCGKFSGMPVITAKDKVKDELLSSKEAEKLYELSNKVVCRCLTPCMVKTVSDQWFVAYGNEEWKVKARQALELIKLYPEETRSQFKHTIEWLKDWPCAREFGLGSHIPWDQKWLIEALSDSTIYMSYYTIAHKIKSIPIDQIDDNFFDYVLLGKEEGKKNSKVNPKLIDELKNEFMYWYPVDFRNSGKDLVQNHLTFFIFNHVAIFPIQHWPKGIGVNGWVTVEGEKMSKSKGNFILLRELPPKYSADATRITIISGGEGFDDTNWSSEFAANMKTRLENFYRFCIERYGKGRENKENIDEWIDAKMNQSIKDSDVAMEKTLFRTALQKCFFDMQNDIKWYLARTNENPNKGIMEKAIETQLLLIAPFAPHLCEELWEKIGKKTFISKEKWPETTSEINKGIILREETMKKLIDDLNNILKVIKEKKTKLYLYVVKDDELEYLAAAGDFIKKRYSFESVSVFSVKDKTKYDPQGKASKAKPGKPAIYLE